MTEVRIAHKVGPCPCECDHPLEHVIEQALNVYWNDLYATRYRNMVAVLREGLNEWREAK